MSAVGRFVALLMAAGKNVLFAGAPGVGKTELAIRAAGFFTSCKPLIEAGREDLSFDDLTVRYVVEGGQARRERGSLAEAVAKSWESIKTGGGPCHFVFDEVNRANVDLALGRIFTALDIEHRPRVEVFREAGVNPPQIPLSFRFFATMNVVDRGHLFRLSFAFLRRFAYIYVPPPHKPFRADFNRDALAAGVGVDLRPYAQRAVHTLFEIERVVPEDIPTIIRLPRPDPDWLLKQAEELGVARLLGWALGLGDSLGLEVGPAVLLDVFKVLAVYVQWPRQMLTPPEFLDFTAASLVVPHFAAVLPRLRQRLIVSGRKPREAAVLRDAVENLGKVFGENSAAYRTALGLLYDLPEDLQMA